MTDSAVTKPNHPARSSERTAGRQLEVRWQNSAVHANAQELLASGLFNAQTWIDRSPWRTAALWSGVAGALAAGATLGRIEWRTLVLALLLVDVLWGSVWRLAGGRKYLLPLGPRTLRQQVWLPYLQPGSPAARVFSGDHEDLWPLAFRVGAPAIVLTLVVAAVLGVDALVITLTVVALTLLGWTARHTLRGIPIVLYSLVSVGLPWVLVMRQIAPAGGAASGWAPLALAGLWVLHHWGEVRIEADSRDVFAMVLLASGELAICALLIVVQAPLWLAAVVLLFLPAWLAIVQGQAVGRMRPLWLLSLLLSALALGQVL